MPNESLSILYYDTCCIGSACEKVKREDSKEWNSKIIDSIYHLSSEHNNGFLEANQITPLPKIQFKIHNPQPLPNYKIHREQVRARIFTRSSPCIQAVITYFPATTRDLFSWHTTTSSKSIAATPI